MVANGSIYASGQTPYQTQNLALKLQESDLRDLTINSQGLSLGKNCKTMSIRKLVTNQLKNFLIRFVAVATCLDNGKKS